MTNVVADYQHISGFKAVFRSYNINSHLNVSKNDGKNKTCAFDFGYIIEPKIFAIHFVYDVPQCLKLTFMHDISCFLQCNMLGRDSIVGLVQL